MKKIKRLDREQLHQLKKEKKALKRLRKNKKYYGQFSNQSSLDRFYEYGDKHIINKFTFELDEFIDKFVDVIPTETSNYIKIKPKFSLEDNYDETIESISIIRKSIVEKKGEKINIDFKKCKKVDFAALFLLRVILDEFLRSYKKLDSKLKNKKTTPHIRIIHSENDNVNLKLLANEIIPKASVEENYFVPISSLKLIRGRKPQKNYAENKKGSAITKIRKYINKGCLNRHHVTLNDQGIADIDGLLSEILNNAEDHSAYDTWFVFGNLFETNGIKEKKDGSNDKVSEINLAILNFGYSIFDGFENTKKQNKKTYNEMDKLYNYIISKNRNIKFTKENLFTLYAIQDGKSRLNFEDSSRGTGTMKFIKSFLNLGDYEDREKGYIPCLYIYSGSTCIKFDNELKPFMSKGANFVSLNKENDITLPPEKSHLTSLKKGFPGTLLVVKIYLNEEHLIKKMTNHA